MTPGKVAIVTGGARGIGRATAVLLASRGVEVVAADLLEGEPVERVSSLIFDVTDPLQVRDLVRGVAERYGRLDILIANAGVPYRLNSLTCPDDVWNTCLDVNLKAVWHCARESHPLLSVSGKGSIVTVGSIQGVRSGPDTFPYSAAKAGLLGLTRSLAVEYAPRVRVNAVIPGQVQSVRTEPYFASFADPEEARRRTLAAYPMKRLGQPEDVAAAIAFLASDEAGWITGASLSVDGGFGAALPGIG